MGRVDQSERSASFETGGVYPHERTECEEAPHPGPPHCAAARLEGGSTSVGASLLQHVKQPNHLSPATLPRPSFVPSFRPLLEEGARNAGCPMHPGA